MIMKRQCVRGGGGGGCSGGRCHGGGGSNGRGCSGCDALTRRTHSESGGRKLHVKRL